MLEIADVLREAGGVYLDRFEERMPASHIKAMRDLVRCRTAELGGHLRQCDRCEEIRYTYHSCRNRHCPKCQGEQTARWLQSQQERRLDCPYFLLTFTLPGQLRALARSHQRDVYGALFRSAAGAVLHLAQDQQFLGGDPGILGVLHTWTRDLQYHPHVHFLVTGGGLTRDKSAWRKPQNSEFLMPGRVLSELFRNRLREELGDLSRDASVPPRVWRSKWVVHAKHAGSGKEVLEYLSRYVHRVALPNSRLESFDGQRVTFRYRDSRTQELRRCTLSAEEFLRRFLQHVLPKGLFKVRSYGLFASARKGDLQRARDLIERERLAHNRPPPESLLTDPQDNDSDPVCPECGVGRLRIVADIAPVTVLRVSLPRAPPRSAQRVCQARRMLIS